MKNNKKGISMLVLVTTVVVLVIISTTVVISGVSVSNNFKKQEFAIELSYVQAAVNNYKANNNNTYPLLNNSFTIDTTTSTVSDQFAVEPKTSNNITLYEIDMQKLGNIETKYGHKTTDMDAYAVSQSTGIVYYITGINVSGKLYYTLNDELKELIDYTGITGNVENKDGIMFFPNITYWSNSAVDSTLYIPTSYIVNSVIANGTTIAMNNTSNGYYVYNINNITANSKACNYTVVVSYTKNNISYTQNYSVSNVDVISPALDISDVITIEENTLNKNNIKYIKINKVSDDLSGIKYIKYETENISADDAPTYFSSNGVPVQNDIVEIPTDIKNVTIYVEDNAGNNIVKNITI